MFALLVIQLLLKQRSISYSIDKTINRTSTRTVLGAAEHSR